MSIESEMIAIAKSAKAASKKMATSPADQKNKTLLAIADQIEKNASEIKSENQKDLIFGREKGLSSAMIDRLTVSDNTIQTMAGGLREIALLQDPVGALDETRLRPNGLQVSRMRIPLGVIGIVYESRPNVTVDAAGLCLKAGNSVILRGGSEAMHSNLTLAACIGRALVENNLPAEAVQVVPVRDREAVMHLLKQEAFIDLIIPRGGEGLIRFVVDNSKIPVLKHYKGVCHVYVDEGADLKTAEEICFNSKVQRPGVCNAMETLLVHTASAGAFLPVMADRFQAAGVRLKGCPETRRILPSVEPAVDADWPAEYLDLILAVRVVQDLDQAIEHITLHGSDHTEASVTQSYSRANRFLREVGSSVVLVNASTRFSDGGQLGLGAEIGISTSKLHAFGPMGLKELTTTKFIVQGNGQVRE